MYKKLAHIVTDYYISKGIVSDSKKIVYQYGFEILLSSIVYSIIFIITASISNTLLSSFIFWLGFFLVRKISGGFHCDTYIACHILFFTVHILSIIIIKIIPVNLMDITSNFLIICSILIIFFVAPVDNYRKPFIKNERKRFRFISIIYIFLLIILFIALNTMLNNISSQILCFSIGTFIASLSLIAGKIQNKRKEKI